MRPNQEQLTTIENILGDVSKYRETYEELYDHILSALEGVPDDMPFADALYNIVENELGGGRGIALIEAKYKKAAIKEIAKKYFKYFGQYLVSPYMVGVIALTGMLYWLINGETIRQIWVTVLCFISNTIVIRVRERWINKTINPYGKNSVIKIVYPYICMFPMILSVVLDLIHIALSFVGLPYVDPRLYIALVVFFINLVNMLAYYRLCKDEFKVITTT
ncbi:MAG: hypothetical protein V4553_06225 [Bacteroidota bacterium]